MVCGPANASSKKIAAANKRTISNLRKGFIAVNVTYFLWRIVYHWQTFTTVQMVLYVLSLGVSLFFYSVLEGSAESRYDASGALVASGDDLNAEGLTAYMFDIIYITWATHLLTAFISNKGWYLYLVIPAYAAYKIFPMAMSYFGSKEPQTEKAETDGKSKRQAKMEKRQNKGQVKYKR
ncbi:hypothetical protein J3Q64DRAFT_1841959 [Phycomyces blakesleeanus]|uniref:DUF788-domain-containing protein n=2 Tax=Phycomyces blakesleeanus TaxID=4837 RepID=A0ABR3AIJ0_PHYBL